MKLRSLRTPRRLAFAGFLLSVSTLTAASVPDPVNGDLFIGFRAAGGQGAAVSYLFRIGTQADFPQTPGTSFTLSSLGIAGVGLDLASASNGFGANWFDRSDLYWSVFSVSGNAQNPSVYGSRERTTAGQFATPWAALDSQARTATSGAIGSVLNGVGGYKSSTATANNPVGTFQVNADTASSYNKQVATPGTTDFSTLSQWTGIEGSFVNSSEGTILDLFRVGPTGTSYRGTFAINDAGSITYAFLPEPSSLLLFSTIATAFAGYSRRRTT